MSELNSAAFTAWKLACINNGCSVGKLYVCTKSQREKGIMVNHPIGPFSCIPAVPKQCMYSLFYSVPFLINNNSTSICFQYNNHMWFKYKE